MDITKHGFDALASVRLKDLFGKYQKGCQTQGYISVGLRTFAAIIRKGFQHMIAERSMAIETRCGMKVSVLNLNRLRDRNTYGHGYDSSTWRA